jgi:hypothetical protein
MQQNRFIFFSPKSEEFSENISSWIYAGKMKAYISVCNGEAGFVLEELVTSQNPRRAMRRYKGCVSCVMSVASTVVSALFDTIQKVVFSVSPAE